MSALTSTHAAFAPNDTMILLDRITFQYPGQPPVLRDLSLAIRPGEYVAVMGPNGAGKSTLALLLKGVLSPSAGRLTVDGQSAADGDHVRMTVMERVGLVFQNPENTMVATTVEEEIAFGLENLALPRDEMIRRVDDALERFHLAPYRHSNPQHLSGGEQQRLALAAVMAMRPRWLVLDEPTALLDPPSRRDFLALLDTMSAAGASIIHITQSAAEARKASRLIFLAPEGEVLDGSPESVLETSGWTGSIAAIARTASEAMPDDLRPPVVSLDDVVFWYEPGTPFAHEALRDIRLTFPAGSTTVLLGPSGAGKTTLLELAAGVIEPTHGRVTVTEGLIRALAFQLAEDHLFGKTVSAYCAFGPDNLRWDAAAIDSAVDAALATVGLEPAIFRERDPFALSAGEKRRLALAGVLSMRPNVLFLDEPTAGLDREGVIRVAGILERFKADGGTIIFSTHDFAVARLLANRAAVIIGGNVETCGSFDSVLEESPWIASLGDLCSGDEVV